MAYIVRAYRRGEEEYVAALHKRLYSEEYSWGPDFTDYAMKIAMDFAGKDRDTREELFVAEEDDELIGSIMLCGTEEPVVGQLRLYAVEKAWRGRGVGNALLSTLMHKAKEAGYKKLVLWTASPLEAAICQYEGLGFKRTEYVENNTWRTDGGSLFEIKMEMAL